MLSSVTWLSVLAGISPRWPKLWQDRYENQNMILLQHQGKRCHQWQERFAFLSREIHILAVIQVDHSRTLQPRNKKGCFSPALRTYGSGASVGFVSYLSVHTGTATWPGTACSTPLFTSGMSEVKKVLISVTDRNCLCTWSTILQYTQLSRRSHKFHRELRKLLEQQVGQHKPAFFAPKPILPSWNAGLGHKLCSFKVKKSENVHVQKLNLTVAHLETGPKN